MKLFIKRYALFTRVQYYPCGGPEDMITACHTRRKAIKLAKQLFQAYDDICIYDRLKEDYVS